MLLIYLYSCLYAIHTFYEQMCNSYNFLLLSIKTFLIVLEKMSKLSLAKLGYFTYLKSTSVKYLGNCMFKRSCLVIISTFRSLILKLFSMGWPISILTYVAISFLTHKDVYIFDDTLV